MFVILVFIAIAGAVEFLLYPKHAKSPTAFPATEYIYPHSLLVGNKKLFISIERTEKEMEQGLSGTQYMADNNGMLFDFGSGASVTPSFWMKDMDFDLDFIWIKNNTVIGITPNVPAPPENLKSKIESLSLYPPPSPVDSALEVNAGWAEKNHIRVGDVVKKF